MTITHGTLPNRESNASACIFQAPHLWDSASCWFNQLYVQSWQMWKASCTAPVDISIWGEGGRVLNQPLDTEG